MSERPPYVPGNPLDIEAIKAQCFRPKRMTVTGGMPYANGPLHLGHLAGALIPPDIYARYMRMLIGAENVLFVCGTDDHGSTSELAALQAGVPVREFIDGIHAKQMHTLNRYSVSVDTYTGTSRPECFPLHQANAQDFIRKLYHNGMLEKKTSRQWFDVKIGRFLQDRLVRGKCPNPKCDNEQAYSDECEKCGTHYDPAQLIHPRSAVSDSTPELRDTVHWWLDLWKVSEELRTWIQSKEKKWRPAVLSEVLGTVMPALSFDNTFEAKYKTLKDTLPKHKSKYAAGKKVALSFENKKDLETATDTLTANEIKTELQDGWAHRSISRDVSWGIPMPADLDPEMEGKTLYVWPDSLIAPISFTQVALAQKGRPMAEYLDFWYDADSRIAQFLGQDNVYFYVLMQGVLFIGTQKDIHHLPGAGDLQLSDVFSCFHLMVNGEKMSKSTGNFYSGDQLLDEKGYTADQLRYFLAMLSLPEKSSNFDFKTLDERNHFLAGPLNAAFEKPISACHSKFGGKVPAGKLLEKVQLETANIVKRYLRSMERAEYATLLNAVENYARQINSIFTQYKPHDDRMPEDSRADALYSSFYVLKNLMILLYPFVPDTMDRLRISLNLDPSVFSISELGVAVPAGHEIGEKLDYFPATLPTS